MCLQSTKNSCRMTCSGMEKQYLGRLITCRPRCKSWSRNKYEKRTQLGSFFILVAGRHSAEHYVVRTCKAERAPTHQSGSRAGEAEILLQQNYPSTMSWSNFLYYLKFLKHIPIKANYYLCFSLI